MRTRMRTLAVVLLVLAGAAQSPTLELGNLSDRARDCRKRANDAMECVSKRGDQMLRHPFLTNYLYVCTPIRAAFVHVWKSAGSTIARAFMRMCTRRFGAAATGNVTRADLLKRDPSASYTYFSFVRRPDERLMSAIYELHRRAPSDFKSWSLETASPSEFVKAVLTRVINGSLRNHHLAPQVDFLAGLPSLTYMGRVEHIADDLAAITTALFNVSTEARVGLALSRLSGDQRRDRHAEYGQSDSVAALEVSDMGHGTKAMIADAYSADYSCLGYPIETPPHLSPTPESTTEPTTGDLQAAIWSSPKAGGLLT
jgi:hypothetical protein